VEVFAHGLAITDRIFPLPGNRRPVSVTGVAPLSLTVWALGDMLN
jgi:hypothetical protein